MKLRISHDLELSVDDFVTSTQAILAKKGSGKSYTASVQAEELLAAGQQVVVIDPTGAWWGLRASADGKATGHPIAVLGGEHGDIPLATGDMSLAARRTAGGDVDVVGSVIADAIAADHFSAVVDLSLLRKGQANRFVGDFLETLYRRNREPLHLFIDEADLFAPQRPFGDEARTLGAAEDIVRRGRIRGIGCTLITQRPQVLNKNVLSQVDMLTALRMNHPKDIAAIDEWVAVHGDAALAKRMIASLPSLPIGVAWMWAPGQDLFEQATIRKRRTFDSGRTPKAGERVAAPKVLAPVDIQRLGATIAATAEQAKANDPKALKARVAELERQLVEIGRQPVGTVERVVEVPVLKDAELYRLEGAIEKFDQGVSDIREELEAVGQVVRDLEAAIKLARQLPTNREIAARHARDGKATVLAGRHQLRVPAARSVPAGSGPGDASLGSGERKILTALAQYAPGGRTKVQVALLTGYAHTGGGFRNYLGSLRTKALIEGDDPLRITADGLKALGAFTPLPTGRALLDYWMNNVGKAEREILRVLDEEWPTAQPKEYVAIKAGYTAEGGGFRNALGRLRTLDLIMGKAKLVLSGDLREVGAR